MKKNHVTSAIEKYFKKYQSRKISSTELERGVAFLLESEKNEKYVTEEQRNEYRERINDIKVKEIEKESKYSNLRVYPAFRKRVASTILVLSLLPVTALGGCSSDKEDENVQVEEFELKENNAVVQNNQTEQVKEEVKEKVLSSALSFDPNDNKELVERMTNFVVDSLNSGIAIKDFMTEEEIEAAKKADATTVITLEQLMDYYFVLNIEDIDPIDYAKLGYKAKTTDTIIENYQNVANEYSMDLLTIDYDNVIDYSEIVAHRDSAKSINDFNNLIARLNDSENEKEVISEIRDYVNMNYITNESNIPSMAINEQVYRSMFSFDILTNGKGITKDMGIILMEDGTYNCLSKATKEIKNESERAQEATNIRNIEKEKLEESRKHYEEVTNVSDYELKTGAELENEIRENVLEQKAVYVANPSLYEEKTEEKVTKPTTTNTQSSTTVTVQLNPSPVIADNNLPIDNSEFEKYNINPNTATAKQDYEKAVQTATEQQFAASSEHVIKSNEGEAVVAGNDVSVEDYNLGFSTGYYDGNNKLPINNTTGSASYISGYNLGYVQGAKDREVIDKQYENLKPETHYESASSSSETISETVKEQGYTGEASNYGNVDVTVNNNYTETVKENETTVTDSENKTEETQPEPTPEIKITETEDEIIVEEFVPVDGEEEIVEEYIDEAEYTASAERTLETKVIANDTNSIKLKYLNALKELVSESSKVVEETEEVLNRVR